MRKNTRSKPRARHATGYVVAVDIGGTNLRIALANNTGKILAKWSGSTKSNSSPKAVVRLICDGAGELLKEVGAPPRSLLAVAAGAPGVTDRDAGIVFATSYLKGWKDVPLADLLQSALHVPAVVENDVKLAAVGENWIGAARGVENFVFLAIGTGIAAGIFVNGQLLHGPERIAGEVGYLIVPGTPESPAGPGEPGSLEGVIGGEGIRQRWHVSRGNGDRDLAATQIFDFAVSGDRLAKDVLEQTAQILAHAIYNISTILNPSLFVLGGGVGISKPLLVATQCILQPYTQPSRPRLVSSALGADAQLIGAVRLALNKAESRANRKHR
jgi:glucokinase